MGLISHYRNMKIFDECIGGWSRPFLSVHANVCEVKFSYGIELCRPMNIYAD